MNCPQCDFENPVTANFCGGCGNKIELVCPKCEYSNPASHKFCNECGQGLTSSSAINPSSHISISKQANVQKYIPQSIAKKILAQKDRIEGERKQVTILFSDMVGSTALSEQFDPEDIYPIMDKILEILVEKVHDYEGYVKDMAGDGIMALFGAPIALEDAPQRAIRTAFSIHREIAKFSDRLQAQNKDLPTIKMRIGIHTGPVVVGMIGHDLKVEFTAVGNTVNLASRLEKLAEPGVTLISEETFKLTEGLFRFETLGQKSFKGIKQPVSVYRPIVPRSRRTRFDVSTEKGLTPYIGREREIELLLDSFERVKAGRGQAFSIVSEAGVGKSRFLYEFRKALGSSNVMFIEGRCLSYSSGVAYHPLIDILKANFDILKVDKDADIIEKVKKGLEILNIDEASTLPYLLELLSVRTAGMEKISMSPKGKKDRIMSIYRQISIKGSDIRPLILAFEDLHWIDESSEGVLKYILDGIPGARVLLIFTYRPTFVHTWGSKSYHSHVNLNRLSNRESLEMVSHLLRTSEIESALEEFILEKTDGIPFFIEELLKSLRDLKIITKKDNVYSIAKDIQTIAIPSTIEDVIMARVDSLPEEVKKILQISSVVGRDFSHRVINSVMALSESDLLSYLSALKNSELIYERGVYPSSTYVFKHALTQEVAYNSLLSKKRKEIHGEIGKAIEKLYADRLEEHYELLAYHFTLSDKVEKAIDYLELANEKAAMLSAMDEAKASFYEALKLMDTLPCSEKNQHRRLSLAVNQVAVFMLLLEIPEYHDLLTRFEPESSDFKNQSLLGAFFSRVGICEFGLGRFDDSIATLTKAAQLCEQVGNAGDAGFAYTWLEWGLLYKGDFEQVLAVKKDLLRMMDQEFNHQWYAWGLCAASRANTCLGLWDDAIKEGKKAFDIAQTYDDNSIICVASRDLSIAHTSKGELEKAAACGELMFQKALTPADKAWAQRSLGWSMCRAGEWNKGIKLMIEALPTFKAGRWLPSLIPMTCTLGEGYLLSGDYANAKKTLDEGLEIFEHCGVRFYLGWAHRLLGELATKTSIDFASAHFEQSISILHEIKARNELALSYAGYGRYYKEQKEPAKARECFSNALEIFKELGTKLETEKISLGLSDLS